MKGFVFRELQGHFKFEEKNGKFAFRGDYSYEPMLDPLNTFVGVIVRFYCRQSHN